jgi:tetratricopeptide (TPR) repeat protein
MQLTKQLLNESDSPGLSVDERAILRCRLARQFEAAGDYEAASEAMVELWQGIGARPELEGLDEDTKAQVLLRIGVLTGWIGSAGQIEGSQEAAKDLISESLRMFEQLGRRSNVGEARSDLALCYWRAGAFDEARVTLKEALSDFAEGDVEQKAIALLRAAEVERASTRLSEALRVYNEAAPLFAEMTDDLLIAHFHHGFANVLNQLSTREDNKEYVDRALIEYTAASFHFEQANQERYEACVENNLGFLFSTIGKFDEAHEHLDRAQVLLTKLQDILRLAQVDETRARVFLAEGRIVEAEKIVRTAVHRLGKGDEVSWLTEALTTHGIALARLNHLQQARRALERAINISEQAGDFESAGVSALIIVEQIGRNLSTREICETIDRAGTLLEKTQDITILRRLAKAVFESLFLSHAVPAHPDWEGFSLKEAMRKYEAHLVKLALKETGGMVTAAARLLGFRHHQSLITLIGSRHKELIETGARAPVRPRRSHLIAHPKPGKNKKVRRTLPNAD